MNPPPEIRPSPLAPPAAESETAPPDNLLEAFIRLLQSRSGLIRIESKAAMKNAARGAMFTGGAVFCLLFAWLLLLVASIQLIADALDCPWSWVAIGAAILHLLCGIVMARSAKTGAVLFPVTRKEFTKDREWIENFKTKRSDG